MYCEKCEQRKGTPRNIRYITTYLCDYCWRRENKIKPITNNPCKCGCGGISKYGDWLVGHHKKGMFREKAHRWGGGKRLSYGYKMVYMPEHDRSHKNGYVYEHIIAAEGALGKPLPPKVVIHHPFGEKDKEQIVICENQKYHFLLHKRERAYSACGNPNYVKCKYCKQFDNPTNMYVFDGKNGGYACHANCANNYNRRNYNKKKRLMNDPGYQIDLEEYRRGDR